MRGRIFWRLRKHIVLLLVFLAFVYLLTNPRRESTAAKQQPGLVVLRRSELQVRNNTAVRPRILAFVGVQVHMLPPA